MTIISGTVIIIKNYLYALMHVWSMRRHVNSGVINTFNRYRYCWQMQCLT